MDRIRLLLADNDKEFTDAFMKYVINAHSSKVGIAVINDLAKLIALKETAYKADMLLISESFLERADCALINETSNCVGIITDSSLSAGNISKDDGGDNIPYFTYMKYSNMNLMINKILSDCRPAGKTGDGDKGMLNAKKIFVTSPAGGSGKSFISSELARMIAAKEKKVLLLQIENVSLPEWLFPEDAPAENAGSCGNMSQAYLSIKNNSGDLHKRIGRLILTDKASGIDYIPPSIIPGEGCEITPEEMMRLVNMFAAEYEFIITDAGTIKGCDFFAFSNGGGKVIVITGSSMAGVGKLNALIRYTTEKGLGMKLEDNIIIVKNNLYMSAYRPDCSEEIFDIDKKGSPDYNIQLEKLFRCL